MRLLPNIITIPDINKPTLPGKGTAAGVDNVTTFDWAKILVPPSELRLNTKDAFQIGSANKVLKLATSVRLN